MKSNFTFKFIFFSIFYLFFFSTSSEELKFEATSIEIIDKDDNKITNSTTAEIF